MATAPKKSANIEEEEDIDIDDKGTAEVTDDAIEDDGTPVLDEQDLEENHISVEEAEDIEWEQPKGSFEKNKATSGGGKDTNEG